MDQPLSYRVNISLDLDWSEIIRICFPEIKDKKEGRKFISKLIYDQKLNLNREKSLTINPISLVEFYDSVSGLNFSWDSQNKRFLKDLSVVGYMFHQDNENRESLEERFPKNEYVSRPFTISPNSIGFGTGMYFEEIANFPYYEVMMFFLMVQKHTFRGNHMIKKFPQRIQDVFSQKGIQYRPSLPVYVNPDKIETKTSQSSWLEENDIEIYEQRVDAHFFETKYYTVYLEIEFFSSHDRDMYFI